MSLWLPRPHPRVLARQNLRLLYNSNPAHHNAVSASVLLAHRLVRLESTSSRAVSSAHAPTSVEDPTKNGKPAPQPPAPKEPKDVGEPQKPLMTRVWAKVKHEAQHYWHGSKLLAKEVRISTRLQWKILHGESLTRRERRQVRVVCQSTVWELG